MLLFCPTCSNMLTVSRTLPTDEHLTGQNRLECRTCPFQYVFPKQRHYERRYLPKKEVEDAVGEEDEGEVTDAQCVREGCGNREAKFYQVQTRSADEPMTTFYECKKCGTKWKEN